MAIDTSRPALATFDDHVQAIERATATLLRHAGQTWLGAAVPTCPGWDVLDLVAHQGMVHRWATAAVLGDREAMGNADLLETEGRTSADPLAWLATGAERLVATLRAAPPDLETLVFLKEAPPARDFWARRQCHETTIHALDAVSATLGRARVSTGDATGLGLDPALAADGVDELLVGFFQRSRTRVRSTSPYAVHVRPDDVAVSWLVTVSDEPVRTRRVPDGEQVAAGDVLSGPAADLLLALWNRGDAVADPDGVLPRWREDGAVRW